MDINQEQLRELIIELINFTDKKVSINEMTTKGCGDLKYKIYSNNKEKYNYNGFLIKGSIGHGKLSSDVGIAFLLGENKITNGIYIYLTYNYLKQEIYLKLGSSHQSKNVIDLEKKNVFNNRYRINYYKDFNYFEITESLIKLLDIFEKSLINLQNK